MRIDIAEKRFGSKIIFRDRSFEFQDGQRTAILAESGKGKTTLMRLLSGLDHDFRGTIDGQPQRPLVLFQEDRLSEGISVLSNLMAVTDDRDDAYNVLADVGLGGEEHVITRSLSGGMKRRLAIARILLLDFDVLFLDEPFRGLDAENKAKIASLLLERSKGHTVVFITHEEEDISLLKADAMLRL